MSALLWRVIIAVVCLVIIFALMTPLIALMGIGMDGNVLQILRVCIVGIAILYILKGPPIGGPPVG